MLDYSNRLDADGKISDIIEIARENNPLLDFLPWEACNDGSRHKTTMRTGIPAPTWRALYGGVQPTKSKTAPVYATTGIMHQYAEVDCDLVEQNDNKAAWLLSEHTPFIDGLNEQFISAFFYGGGANSFPGLSSFYNLTTAENGRNVITSGTTLNTSFWVLGLGPQGLHGIYPKGFPMGIDVNHKGKVTLEDADGSNGGRMEIYRSHYRWACGFALRNWQTCARVQVDLSECVKTAATGPNLFDELSKALARTKRGKSIKKVIVANEGTLEMMRLQAKHAVSSSTLSRGELHGRDVDMIDGMPVLLTDGLLYTEDAVT
jgi:hypothetical protein